MNPDTLRAHIADHNAWAGEIIGDWGEAHAVAWGAERADWSGAVGDLQAEVHLLNERLEVAEIFVAQVLAPALGEGAEVKLDRILVEDLISALAAGEVKHE